METVELRVDTQKPRDHELVFTWLLNDQVIHNADSYHLTLSSKKLGEGKHFVKVEVFDPSPYVKKENLDYMTQSKFWQIHVSDVPPNSYVLQPAYPNPFNSTVTFKYQLFESGTQQGAHDAHSPAT